LTARVLVTGGAGFIGSHLVDRLLDDGQTVTVLDNFSTGSERNLAAHAGDPNLHMVRGSVLDEALVDRLIADSPVVYHLAAAVGVRNIVEDPLGSLLTNVNGTERVLASAHRHRARILLASTSEVYGRSEKVPFREDGERILGPTSVHRWSYATAKALDEHLAFAYLDRGLRISIVRYFNSYGPRIHQSGYGSVIARFAWQALSGKPLTVHGDGGQTRCFTFVSDTVDGTVRAGTRDEAIGAVFNIGSQREVSIAELARQVRDNLHSKSEIALEPYERAYPKGFEDTRRRVPDVTKAREVLGFEAKVDLADGLGRTLQWCRENYEVVVG
jgi:nucleoside-diphosphate-sugar epimerase